MADLLLNMDSSKRDIGLPILMREHPRASLNDRDVQDPNALQLRQAGTTFQRRHRRLSRARELDLILGTELQYQSQICADYRRHYDDSADEFTHQANLVARKAVSSRSATKLEELHAQLVADNHVWSEQFTKTERLAKTRSEHASKVKGLESMLNKAVSALLALLDAGLGIANESYDDDSAASQATSPVHSQRDHPLLEDYYDKSGDVAIMRERLNEVYSEYVEDRAQRIFRADQEQALESSDDDFDASYEIAIREAQQNIQDAMLQREEALRRCNEAGVQIPPPKPASEPSEASSVVTKIEPTHVQSSVIYTPTRSLPSEIALVSSAPPAFATGHMRPDGAAERHANIGSCISEASIETWLRDVRDAGPTSEAPDEDTYPATPCTEMLEHGDRALSEEGWLRPPLQVPSNEHKAGALASSGEIPRPPTKTTVPGSPQSTTVSSVHRYSTNGKRSWSDHGHLVDYGYWNFTSTIHSLDGGFRIARRSETDVGCIAPFDKLIADADHSRSPQPVRKQDGRLWLRRTDPGTRLIFSSWYGNAGPLNHLDPRAKDNFHVGLIFAADITQLLASSHDKGLNFMGHGAHTDVALSVYVVIENHDSDFSALAVTVTTTHEATPESDTAIMPVKRHDSVIELPASKYEITRAKVIKQDSVVMLMSRTSRPFRGISVDLHRAFKPLEYNTRCAHYCGDVEKSSLDILVSQWRDEEQKDRTLKQSWLSI
ncbi:hypothetical protein LTR95_001283 [Oleoguttula sp. CCFEE 5521]